MSVTSFNDQAPKSSLTTPQQRRKTSDDKRAKSLSMVKIMKIVSRALFESRQERVPQKKIPLQRLTRADIESLPAHLCSVVRLGHSTVLMKIANQLWLLDPVFSERASPLGFLGPKRFHPTPIELTDLPDLDGVIISHNHYDHMDENTIKSLHQKVKRFVVPSGNGSTLETWGVPSQKITELAWWQSLTIDELELISTPAQHFSGRGLYDRDKALWSSWVIRSQQHSLFFSGDSGYFDEFKTIGRRYGPFDMTLLECGAYDAAWPDVHMKPRHSAQAHLDLKGRKMLPIHNGTFNLAFHAWVEPFEQIVEIANQEWIDLLTPLMGQVVTLGNDTSVDAARDLFWWRDV